MLRTVRALRILAHCTALGNIVGAKVSGTGVGCKGRGEESGGCGKEDNYVHCSGIGVGIDLKMVLEWGEGEKGIIYTPI